MAKSKKNESTKTDKKLTVVNVESFKRHKKDNGSPEFQIACLSSQILKLQSHIAQNAHDVDAKRSLLRKVARRRSFLRYIKNQDIDLYNKISEEFKIKI